MKYISHYKISGGLKHTFITDNEIKTATPEGELIFTDKQKKQQRMVLEMMEFLLKVTKKHKIKWFAICGTLLGAVRNQGIIPYDDDGDVGFLMSEHNKFLKLTTMDLHPQFEFIVSECGFQLVQKEHFEYVTHFDMFAFDVYDNPDKLVYAGQIYNGKPIFYGGLIYPREWIYKKDVDKIIYRKFEHLMIPTPADPIEYLSHLYSPNCLTTYVPDSRNINGFHLHELFMKTITPQKRTKIYFLLGNIITPFEIHKPNKNAHLGLLLGRILTIPAQMDNNLEKSGLIVVDAFQKFIEANVMS
jgi:hypothetical protein